MAFDGGDLSVEKDLKERIGVSPHWFNLKFPADDNNFIARTPTDFINAVISLLRFSRSLSLSLSVKAMPFKTEYWFLTLTKLGMEKTL